MNRPPRALPGSRDVEGAVPYKVPADLCPRLTGVNEHTPPPSSVMREAVCVRPLLLVSGRGLWGLCRGRRPRRPVKRAVGIRFRSIRESPLRRKRQFTAFSDPFCQGQPSSQGALNETNLFRFVRFHLNATAPDFFIANFRSEQKSYLIRTRKSTPPVQAEKSAVKLFFQKRIKPART